MRARGAPPTRRNLWTGPVRGCLRRWATTTTNLQRGPRTRTTTSRISTLGPLLSTVRPSFRLRLVRLRRLRVVNPPALGRLCPTTVSSPETMSVAALFGLARPPLRRHPTTGCRSNSHCSLAARLSTTHTNVTHRQTLCLATRIRTPVTARLICFLLPGLQAGVKPRSGLVAAPACYIPATVPRTSSSQAVPRARAPQQSYPPARRRLTSLLASRSTSRV